MIDRGGKLLRQNLGNLVDRDIEACGQLLDGVAAQHLLQLLGRDRQTTGRLSQRDKFCWATPVSRASSVAPVSRRTIVCLTATEKALGMSSSHSRPSER